MSTDTVPMEEFTEWVLEGQEIYKEMLELAQEKPEMAPACDIFKEGLEVLVPMVKEHRNLISQIAALQEAIEEKANELDQKLLPFEELLDNILPLPL